MLKTTSNGMNRYSSSPDFTAPERKIEDKEISGYKSYMFA
jgi:hypothetical protein